MGNPKDAVALAYYSMYHCLLAALFKIGIKCENHSASIVLLKEVFDIDNAKMVNLIATFNEEKIKEYHKKAISLFIEKEKKTKQKNLQ